MAFTTGGLLLRESVQLSALFQQLGDWEAVRAQALQDNLLQTRKASSAKRWAREVIFRLQQLAPNELDLFTSAGLQDQANLIWMAICCRFAFIADFMAEVVRERYLALRNDLAYPDFDAFLDAKAGQHPDLAQISPSTKAKLRQVLFRMLREARLLSRDNQILPVYEHLGMSQQDDSPISLLLHRPESKTLEFKHDLSSPRPWLKTLVAFANSAGGRLIFGVADDHQVIGVDLPLDEEERLCNLIADAIAPRLVPNIELATVDGKTLLIAEVFLSESRPHFIKAEGIEAGVYVRLGSPNRQADAQLIAELQRGIAGGGIPGIFRRVEAENLPEPTIEELAGRLRFTVPLAEILPLALEQSRKGESLQPGLESQGQRSEQVSEQVKVVLRACHIQARSKAELLRALGLANAYLNYKRHLLPLIEQGLIERTIPDKPNSRLQKYRLTDKGEGALAEKSAQAGEGPCNG